MARINSSLFFFAHIPKTGGSSIQAQLKQRGKLALFHSKRVEWSLCSPQHYHAAIHETLIRPGFYDFGFSIIRHPKARVVSEYQFRASIAHRLGRKPLASIDEWFHSVIKRFAQNPFHLDNHIRPQSEFISKGFKVFRLEDGLDRAVSWIDEAAGVEHGFDPIWQKKSLIEKPQLSAETSALIEQFYAADFELFESHEP